MKPRVSTLGSLKTPPTLKSMAFDAIRDSIINGTLSPGKIYSEQVLATELGISKTPVHDALIKLQIRGFINIFPQRGFQLKVLSRKDVINLYEFREALERGVMRHITPHVTAEQIESCRPFMDEIHKSGNDMQFLQNDMHFHTYMAELTNNPQIIKALDGIWDLCLWVGHNALEMKGCMEGVMREHYEIFETLEQHDAAAADTVITKHIQASLERALENI